MTNDDERDYDEEAANRRELEDEGRAELAEESGAAMSTDPIDQVNRLDTQWSDDFDAYAAGQLSADRIRCVLCRQTPCSCPPFGTPEYLALIDRLHGRR